MSTNIRLTLLLHMIANTVCEKINETKLKRLSEHKYSAVGTTYLDPYMQIYWNAIVKKFPIWWSPNCMTLTGLACNIITSLVLVYYSPDAKHDIPSWALILCALGLFVYQTLDACDGKQARRTQTSSSLGELFDHGCDAISTIFVTLSVCEAVQLGYNYNWMLCLCVAANALFYVAHWQTYVTGTLRFGKFDVTEAQFTIMVVLIISAIFGTGVWSYSIVFNLQLKDILIYFSITNALYTCLIYFNHILSGGVGKNGSTVAVAIGTLNLQIKLIPAIIAIFNESLIFYKYCISILIGGVGKNGSSVAGTSVLSPIIPLLLVVIATLTIFGKSQSSVFTAHLCLYVITFGLVMAKITNKLVVAHMSKSEINKLDSILIGPLLLFLNQYFNTFINEYLLLWIALIYTVADFSFYSSSTCIQIANHLKIRILSITPYSGDNNVKSGNLDKSVNGRERHRPYNLRVDRR